MNNKYSREVGRLEKFSETWAALKLKDQGEITLVISQGPCRD